jgi:hypothetical protein
MWEVEPPEKYNLCLDLPCYWQPQIENHPSPLSLGQIIYSTASPQVKGLSKFGIMDIEAKMIYPAILPTYLHLT